MKGDFTRGIEPDRKRGKRYRRVLVQQSRVLLDSDVAALVDSFDHELRQLTSDLGCRLGSPDLGYLITPGRLLALFEHTSAITTTGAGSAMRDYSRKYPSAPEDRYPSLRIQGVTATIPLLEPIQGPFNGPLALWYRADAALTISVSAGTATTSLNLAVANSWTRVTANVAVAAGAVVSSIAIGGAADPVWIGLLELHEDRGPGPHFWAAAGRFHARGLTPELPVASGYPELSYPSHAGFPGSDAELTALANGSRIVAYLETWERGISAAEDPGIREAALGKVDTTMRSEVRGQVKWAPAGALTPDELRRAFRSVAEPASGLVVQAPTTPPSSDPCALPTSGGYTGADHRLYRFEVHVGGAPMVAQIKWSRDNAAQLFPVLARSGAIVTLERASGLEDGDVVEILSEAVELADSLRATVSAAGVTPATRQVGLLARLAQEESDSQGRDRFTLVSLMAPPATIDPGSDPARYPAAGSALRLRRWNGIATPRVQGGSVVASIEDGIELTLSGTFRVGEYWQFEARRGVSNDNGPWRERPHGPERILAPLALLRLPAANQPAVLEAWLDDRFSPVCELDADDVAFDGDRVDSDADTVQEALEELFQRDAGNCCDATLGPNGRTGDDTLRIMAAIGALTFPSGGHLCLEPGVYDIRSPIVIDGDVVIRGCPEATLLAHGQGPIFRVGPRGRLRISQLILYNGPAPSARGLVEVQPGARLTAREVGFLASPAGGESAAISAPGASFVVPDLVASDDPAIDPDNLPAFNGAGAFVQLEDCVLIASVGVLGSRLSELSAERAAFVFGSERGGISALQIDRVRVHDCSFRSGLSTAFFNGVEPERVRAQSDELLEAAAALPVGAGAGISVRDLLGGSLARNHLSCRLGVAARVARDLSARDDVFERLDDRSWGMRLHHVRRVDLEGLRIRATLGIEVPLSARQLSVRGCFIHAATTAITVGGEERELANAGPIVGVLIEGNQVETPLQGIAVGAGGTRASEVDDVRITNNVVRTASGASNATGILVIGDSNPASAIVVDGNEITTDRVGMRIAGAGGLLRNNQIRLTANNGPAITAFGSARIGQVTVADNVISGVNNSFSAIELLDTAEVSVTGNQVNTSAARHILEHPGALSVRGTGNALRQYIVGNDFAVGGCTINGASNLHLVGNMMRTLLVDSGASGQNGLIHGNQLGVILIVILPISAQLSGLRGMWKISDNLAPGGVSIAGSTHQELLWGSFFGTANRYGKMAANLAEVQAQGGANSMLVNGVLGSSAANATTKAGVAKSLAALGQRTATSSSATAGVEISVDRAIEDLYVDAGHELFGPLEDYLIDHELVLQAITVVDPFDFHVSGNRVGLLVIGPANGQTAEATSSLHAVDNKITLNANITMTAGDVPLPNVVALNSANLFNLPIDPVSGSIRVLNLRR